MAEIAASQLSRRRFLEKVGLGSLGLATMPSLRAANEPKPLPTKVKDLVRCPSHPLTFPVLDGGPLGSPATSASSFPTVAITRSENPGHLIVGLQLALSFIKDSNGPSINAENILERGCSFRLTDTPLKDYVAQPKDTQLFHKDGELHSVSGPNLTYERVGGNTLPIAHQVQSDSGIEAKTNPYREQRRSIYLAEYLFPNALCQSVADAKHPLLNPVFFNSGEGSGWAIVALAKNQGGLPVPLISGDDGPDFISRHVLFDQKPDAVTAGYAIVPITVELPMPETPNPDISVSSSGVSVKFLSQEHVDYQIEASSTMAKGSWQPVATPIQGDGRMNETSLTASSTSQFYRVRAELNLTSYMKVLDSQ